ncbi:ABC-three component system middle component 1 [Exiguobacterium qingdaonense]|uniref:ABC-three component system middle component 1 n=1 Tax=Exiguobacterium qingdaonense TaxID=2751251 RepID=UPI001BEC5C05|nr:ABC-three component system middle component 1 [Exiguobacterium qingdaonense]
MKNIIKKIYLESQFESVESQSGIINSNRENKEFLITVDYSIDEFINFFECEKTDEVINLFNQMKENDTEAGKNTSLILLLEVESINEFYKKYKNQVLRIEEDEYFFRKYLIVYTSESIKKIKDYQNMLKELHIILLEESRLEKFQENLYLEEEYFVVIQLFVKIPFVQLDLEVEEYRTLESKINEVILRNNLLRYEKKVFEYIRNSSIDRYPLLRDSALDFDESDLLSSFFEHFEVNKK